jgi:hypothetical protein
MLTGSTGGTVLALGHAYVYIQRLLYQGCLSVGTRFLRGDRDLVNSEATVGHPFIEGFINRTTKTTVARHTKPN